MDLKPNNIIVDKYSTIYLIDIDRMIKSSFVPLYYPIYIYILIIRYNLELRNNRDIILRAYVPKML